ncbi:MAG: peptide chain release factor N(5)-glutamine methyltransferase [Dehalococcoidales bacterium]|nr:peptide chain release factor N(5)-glutamine methyltransferase [Dehalococcoidales bacterium]
MNVREALAQARDALTAARIEEAPLESSLLLRHVLKITPVELYLDSDRVLTPVEEQAFLELIRRRIAGEPSAYITCRREFYGREFYVDPRVLIPRPETELLAEKAITLAREKNIRTIADIGTGSGAIAVTLAKELPAVTIYAADVSEKALEVARINCEKHSVTGRIALLHGNLLEPLPEAVDLIAANLPYVRVTDLPQPPAEPRLALDGGSEGLDVVSELCRQAVHKLKSQGCLLLEIGMGQAPAVIRLLESLYPSAQIDVFPDLAGIARVISMCRNGTVRGEPVAP